MNCNFYWPVYKNLEKELINLSNLIHIDDKQLEIYSIKIAELLLRTAVEVESISKTLYFQNGGTKSDNNNLFFDTDCIGFLENIWLLSKKQIQVSAPNFHFIELENRVLTPLKKANKRGSSSSDWQKAYQSVKHNRVASLQKANLRHLIRTMGALYVLNLYYNDDIYMLDKDSTGVNFDSTLGSSIFSVKLHKNKGFNVSTAYSKNTDFDECIYILRPTDETRDAVQLKFKELNDKAIERTYTTIPEQIMAQIKGMESISMEELVEKIKSIAEKLKSDNFNQVIKEHGQTFVKTFGSLRYEAILNKQQY
jgi:hypothetical protein